MKNRSLHLCDDRFFISAFGTVYRKKCHKRVLKFNSVTKYIDKKGFDKQFS